MARAVKAAAPKAAKSPKTKRAPKAGAPAVKALNVRSKKVELMHNPKPVYSERVAADGHLARRYRLTGKAADGTKMSKTVKEATAKAYGTPKKVAVVAKKRVAKRSCEKKYLDCVRSMKLKPHQLELVGAMQFAQDELKRRKAAKAKKAAGEKKPKKPKAAGRPKKAAGEKKKAVGRPKKAAGEKKAVGRPKKAAGEKKKAVGRPKKAAGSPKAKRPVGRPKKAAGSPKAKRPVGRPKKA